MLCRNPVNLGDGVYVPCGSCLPCRVDKRRTWASRMELEALVHPHVSMVTLTYDDEKIPPNGSLRRKDLTDWLKRIRKAVEPLRLRYFACGEYGGQTWRPHYHCILYGYQSCERSLFAVNRVYRPGECCAHCNLVFQTWGHGLVTNQPVSSKSFRYVAGYVTKKMGSKTHPLLNGREPEFPAMSLKPGIGVPALPLIKKAMEDGFRLWDQSEDVPSYLHKGKEKLKLGKYLQRKLREECGRDAETPEHVKRAWLQGMLDVLAFASENDLIAKDVHLRLGENQAARMEFWEKAKPKKGTL